MPVESFNQEQFENALPRGSKDNEPLFVFIGDVDGELCWAWCMPHTPLRLLVRSSIDPYTNQSADTGEDSIRLIIQRYVEEKWISIGKGPDAYTTRVKGWELRLKKKIKEVFYSKLKRVTKPFDDNEYIAFSRTELNPNRPYACKYFGRTQVEGSFRWLGD